MLIVKLAATLLLVLLPAVIVLRDWKYYDRRTLKHHKITRAILLIWFIASIVTIALLWKETKSVEDMYEKVNIIDREAKKHISEARQSEQSAREESSALSDQLKEMNTKIEPLIKRAVAVYPEYKIDTALAKLINKIETIEVKQDNIQRILVNKTAVPSMSVLSASTSGDYTTTIILTSSNNQPLGRIELQANILSYSDSQILSFTPVGMSLMVIKQLSSDRKTARLGFTMMGNTKPVFKIHLSKRSKVTISGNNELETFEIEIQ